MDDSHATAPLALPYVFSATIQVGAPLDVAIVPGGRRRVVPILGGAVAGPRLAGTVLPGGADWQVVEDDGATRLVARYVIRAADGTLISCVNTGLRHGPTEVLARLAAGEAVDPESYYFRAAPVFEAAPGRHHWLTRRLFVSTGTRSPGEVRLAFHMVP